MFKITISNPQKVEDGDLAGAYVCEVYLPDIEKSNPIYADDPNEVVKNANIFIEVYLKEKIINIERLLNRKDVVQSLTKELDWTRQSLKEHELNKRK